ncbi:MAG TPA: YhjD/YihY/BrkB family envelope integrity protein, partial [Acidimicrobiales bacterium]
MLSLFPAAIALAAGVTLLADLRGAAGGGDVESAIIAWIERFATEEASGFIDSVRALFNRSNSDLLTVALAVSLWSGSRGIDAVVRSVVVIAGDIERRPWWKRRLLSLGLLLGTVVAGSMAVTMLVVGPLLGGGHALAEHLGLEDAFATAWGWLRLPLAVGALVGWAVVLLHVSRPNAGSWRSDLTGAIATAFLWLAATLGLRFYVSVVGASNAAAGALGGAVVALLWLYLLALA